MSAKVGEDGLTKDQRYYRNNREVMNSKNKDYRQNNKEAISTYQRNYYRSKTKEKLNKVLETENGRSAQKAHRDTLEINKDIDAFQVKLKTCKDQEEKKDIESKIAQLRNELYTSFYAKHPQMETAFKEAPARSSSTNPIDSKFLAYKVELPTEKEIKAQGSYYERNKSKVLKYQKTYYANNKEKCMGSMYRWAGKKLGYLTSEGKPKTVLNNILSFFK